MKLGFIGLGVMGAPIGGHLARQWRGRLDTSSLMKPLSDV